MTKNWWKGQECFYLTLFFPQAHIKVILMKDTMRYNKDNWSSICAEDMAYISYLNNEHSAFNIIYIITLKIFKKREFGIYTIELML